MSERLIEEIIQRSSPKPPSRFTQKPPKNRKKRQLTPMFWVTILLSAVLILAIGGLALQNQRYQHKLSLLEAELSLRTESYSHSFQSLQEQIDNLTTINDALSTANKSLLKRQNDYVDQLSGIYNIELIVNLVREENYVLAADILTNFVADEVTIPSSVVNLAYITPGPDGTPFYDPLSKLLDAAETLLQMDLINQSCIDYIQSFRPTTDGYWITSSVATDEPFPDVDGYIITTTQETP